MATISADNLAAGFAGTVFIAYLSGLTSVAYTATQYALFSALMTVLGNFIGGFSGVVVEASSWVSFFLYASAMGLPAIVLSLVVVRRAAVECCSCGLLLEEPTILTVRYLIAPDISSHVKSNCATRWVGRRQTRRRVPTAVPIRRPPRPRAPEIRCEIPRYGGCPD